MKTVIRRTHDKNIYLKEDRYDEPKEIFKKLVTHVKKSDLLKKESVVCDFGCATGEFLYYLHSQYPEAKYYGFDVIPELIKKAKKMVPDVTFKVGSVLNKNLWSASSVDIAFMLGVHSIFDEFETCFSNLLYWTRKGGRILIFGLFNPYPLDVWVKYRLASNPDDKHREPGWNIFSKASVSSYLDRTLGKGRHSFIPFEMPFDLPPHPDDPVRTWTFLDSQDRRMFTNGLCLICHLEILEIKP